MMGTALMSWEDSVAHSEVAAEILQLQRGDKDAFGALLARYQNRLYRYLLRIVRDQTTAEDLFQQTWLRVIEKIRRYDSRRSFEAWLFSVARNLAIDYLRRYRPKSLEEPLPGGVLIRDRISADAPDALERAMRLQQATHVLAALEEQPAVYREVLSLRFEEEMKLEEIAEVLDVPLSTVKTRLRRGLERMRESLVRPAPGEVAS